MYSHIAHNLLSCRGSADAIKQVHALISVLIHDPNQDISQLLPKYVGASSAAASSSSHKRHVTASHDPTPSITQLETFEIASDAQPAKGNPTATSASAAAAPTSSAGGANSRANYRKAGSVSSIATISGNTLPLKLAANVTQSLGGVGGFSVRVGAQNLGTSNESKGSQHSTSLLDSHHASEPLAIHSIAALGTSRASTVSVSSIVKPSQAATSGAVRRLFTSGPHHTPQQQQLPTVTASCQNLLPSSLSVTTSSTRITSTVVSVGGGTAIARTGSAGHGMSVSKASVPTVGRGPLTSKVQPRQHDAPVGSASGTKQSQQLQPSSSHTVVGVVGASERQPSHVKNQVGGTVSMSYSRAINAASVAAPVQDNTQPQSQPIPGGDVIEQPLQQIMNTPTIFQDPATQLAKAKKKSTYSDAVGKKSAGGGSSTVVGVAISSTPTLGIPSAVSSSGSSSGSSAAGGGSGTLVLQVPPSSQQVSTAQQQHPNKIINLAPGSRPVGDKVSSVNMHMYVIKSIGYILK